MSTHTPKTQADEEIDLSAISRGIGRFFDKLGQAVFRMIRFFVRNIIWVILAIVIGFAIGWWLDRSRPYEHQLIVQPNFGSVDYLYSKVDLLNAKISDRDSLFLKSLGIQNPQKLGGIKIEPLVDVYSFVSSNELNFKVLELLAEDGDLNKIVKESTTSKNYGRHVVTLTTNGYTSQEKLIKPLMNFLNSSDFYRKLQQAELNNIRMKMKTNELLIGQIDKILESVPQSANGALSTGTTVVNGQSQLNDIIRTKDALIEEQGRFRVKLVSLDEIVKMNMSVLNMERSKGLDGKKKYIMPILFLLLFAFIYNAVRFYRKQSLRAANAT